MPTQRFVVALVIVLAPGALLLPVWRNAGLGAREDDILYYYPMRSLIADFATTGTFPTSQPWTGGGRPYLADPQTAVFYPTTWLFAVMPAAIAYPASLWAHYSLAMFGGYRLLRSMRISRGAALFGGGAFAFSGFMLAHRAHFSMQHAAAWTPIVIWRLQRLLDRSTAGPAPGQPSGEPAPGQSSGGPASRQSSGGPASARSSGGPASGRSSETLRDRPLQPRWLTTAIAALVIAMQCFAGHVQIVALTAVGAAVVGVVTLMRQPSRKLLSSAAAWIAAWVFAGVVFLVQVIPTAMYLRECTRTQRTYTDFVENSWHPESAIGLVLPMFFGQRTPNAFPQPYWGPSHQVEQFAYPGLAVLVLALLAGRAAGWSSRRVAPWAALAITGTLLALGKFGPVAPILYWLPGAGLFRCPARAMLLVNLALAVLAALALDTLAAGRTPVGAEHRYVLRRWMARPARVIASLIAVPLVIVAWVALVWSADARPALAAALSPTNPALWLPVLISAATLLILHRIAARWNDRSALAALAALVAIDLGVVGWTIDVPADAVGHAALTTPRDGGWIDRVRAGGGRLWVVTGRVGAAPGEYVDSVDKCVANTNILRRVPTLTDYGPLQPREMTEFFGFKPWGESLRAEERLADADAWAARYGVSWILLCDAHWPAPRGFELAETTPQGWRLYRRLIR